MSVNGLVTTANYGPDANGVYGGLNGLGGLESIQANDNTNSVAVIEDYFGNVLACIQGGSVTWTGTRFSSYGPVPGYESPALSPTVALPQALGWRGKRIDETGLVYMGARYYDPTAGNFMSFDPVWNSGDPSGFSAFAGDPVNLFDPTGRYGKQMGNPDSYDALENAQYSKDYFDPRSWGIEDPTPKDDYVTAYQQTQAEMDRTLMQGYHDVVSAEQSFSSAVNMIPLAGGIKQWIEQGFTGTDLITGQRLDPGNTWLTVLGVTANLLSASAYPFVAGMMADAAEGAQFAESSANWQAGNALQWQTGVGDWYGPVKLAEGELPAAEETAPVTFCFPAGTLVLMADGSTKAIEKVQEGDQVRAEDPSESQVVINRPVVQLHTNWTQHLIHIMVSGDSGRIEGELRVTGHHPIWTQNRGWVYAQDLLIGDRLLDAQQGMPVVSYVAPEDVICTTYNLTVQGAHTFFVLAGQIPVLVHNTDIQLHHPWPQYLGGPQSQNRIPLDIDVHEAYHNFLDDAGLPRYFGS